jgi:hypothetical protein
MTDKKDRDPLRNPFDWLFHAALLVLGAVIALNMAITFVRPILPWIVGGIIIAAVTFLVIAGIRSDRRRW